MMIMTQTVASHGGSAEPAPAQAPAPKLRPSVPYVPDPSFDPVSSRYFEAVPDAQ